ncbi:N-acyl homoserine lactonase family protein [Bradyrhizobium tropiciagri]|uniref:N-acyl homoserine lactonase family protein n=1 Tax=Bradyrhizobium tropiciagri TaxID=312253 RepID=UPI000A6AB778|nr:N-acyl homoserine lactonase family protein [Bradyrhizobium tropiciagri]
MKRLFLAWMAVHLLVSPAWATHYADKLIVIDCGEGHADDKSLWSPGENAGQPFDMANNCYLVRHEKGWLLWDTGLPDTAADQPGGLRVEAIRTTWKRKQKLLVTLNALGLKPSDIDLIGLSHLHPDHVGNVALFPQATFLIQTAEYNNPVPLLGLPFLPGQSVKKIDGDYDVFGDGSVQILATPGHTLGHQSLLVRLKSTGTVILSGDVVHSEESWNRQWIPARNVSIEMTRSSRAKIARLLLTEHAQLWINHDVQQSAQQRKAPDFYE